MPEVRYTFTATGHESVNSAFRSIRGTAESTATAVAAASKRSSAAQVGSSKRAAAAAVAISRSSGQQFLTADAAVSAKRLQLSKSTSLKQRLILSQELRDFERIERRKSAIQQREGNKRVRQERTTQRKSGGRGGASRFLSRVGRSVASFGVVTAGLALTGGAASAIRQSIQLGDLSRDISRRGAAPGQARADPRELARSFRRTAIETGSTGLDVARGVGTFLEATGDIGKAREGQRLITEVSVASGTDIEDVASVAATLFTTFGLGKKNMAEMREELSLLVLQGKKGSFEFKDASKGLGRLAAIAKLVGVKGEVEQIGVIGALAQFTKRTTGVGSGSGAKASTFLEATFTELIRKAPAIKKATGFDVGAEAQKDFAGVVPGLIKAFGGDQNKLLKLLPKRAFTGIAELVNQFNELKKAGKSEADAAEILTQKIRDLSDATGASEELQKDLASAQQDTGRKLTNVWQRILESFEAGGGAKAVEGLVAELPKLLPAIPPLVTAFVSVAKAVSAFIGVLSSIPGIGKFFKESPDQKISRLQGELAAADLEASQVSDVAIAEVKSGKFSSKFGSISSATGRELNRVNAARTETFRELQKARQEAKAAAREGDKGAFTVDPETGVAKPSEEFVDEATLTSQAAFGTVGGLLAGAGGAVVGTGFGTVIGPGIAAKASDDAAEAMERSRAFKDAEEGRVRDPITLLGDLISSGAAGLEEAVDSADVKGKIGSAADLVKGALEGAAKKISSAEVSVNPTSPE